MNEKPTAYAVSAALAAYLQVISFFASGGQVDRMIETPQLDRHSKKSKFVQHSESEDYPAFLTVLQQT